MTHNEQVLNRSLDKWKMAPYMDEYPASEPVATTFDDAEQQISSYVQDHITELGFLPDFDEVAEHFNLVTDADIEALEQYFKRERRLMEWKTPSLK